MSTFVTFGLILLLTIILICFFAYIYLMKKHNFKKNIIVYFLPIAGVFLLSFLICLTVRYREDYFNEVWNFKATKVSHQERYSKKVTYTVSVPCGTDKKGRTKYRTEVRHRTDYYGPYFNVYSENGSSKSISESDYRHWVNRWKNEKHLNTIKGTATAFTTPIDGKYFECQFNQQFTDIFPLPEIHSYRNPVRNSHSIFKPTDGKVKYFKNHPAEDNNVSAYFEIGSSIKNANLLNNVNASFGNRIQIHTITLFVKGDQPRSIVDQVLTEWKGLNKNELLICIALDGGKVSWVEVRSWMENNALHGTLADSIINENNLDGNSLSKIYLEKIPQQWKRKSFKDFDYIRSSVSSSYYIVLIVTFFICLIAIPVLSMICKGAERDKQLEEEFYPLKNRKHKKFFKNRFDN